MPNNTQCLQTALLLPQTLNLLIFVELVKVGKFIVPPQGIFI